MPGSTTPQHSATTSTGENHSIGGTTSHNDSAHSAPDSFDQDDVSDGEDENMEICVVDEKPDSSLISPVPITCPDSHSGKTKNSAFHHSFSVSFIEIHQWISTKTP